MDNAQNRLQGAELKVKVDELIANKEGFSAACRACGYTNISKTGAEIPASSLFSRALLDSLGYAFPTSRSGGGGGRGRNNEINVFKLGNAIISKGYVREAGFDVGDELNIDIAEDGTITLTAATDSGGSGAPVADEITREPSSSDAEWSEQQISF